MHRRSATNVFPDPPASVSLSSAKTIAAGKTFEPDEPYTRYDRGSGACSGQSEGGDADAVFLLEEGATLSRVVIGANQAEGVHCLGAFFLPPLFIRPDCGTQDRALCRMSGLRLVTILQNGFFLSNPCSGRV